MHPKMLDTRTQSMFPQCTPAYLAVSGHIVSKSPYIGYADDFVLPADSPAGLQHLIDAAAAICDAAGMIICVSKTPTMVFSAQLVPTPTWHCQVCRCSK